MIFSLTHIVWFYFVLSCYVYSYSRGETQVSPSSRKIHYRPVNPSQLSHKERGGPGRDHSVLMELQLNKVSSVVVMLYFTTALLILVN